MEEESLVRSSGSGRVVPEIEEEVSEEWWGSRVGGLEESRLDW